MPPPWGGVGTPRRAARAPHGAPAWQPSHAVMDLRDPERAVPGMKPAASPGTSIACEAAQPYLDSLLRYLPTKLSAPEIRTTAVMCRAHRQDPYAPPLRQLARTCSTMLLRGPRPRPAGIFPRERHNRGEPCVVSSSRPAIPDRAHCTHRSLAPHSWFRTAGGLQINPAVWTPLTPARREPCLLS